MTPTVADKGTESLSVAMTVTLEHLSLGFRLSKSNIANVLMIPVSLSIENMSDGEENS